jgi:hypothetical protein
VTLVQRPNAWVLVDLDAATTLTYAPRVDPAPLTVSVPGRDPTLGALVVVITNGTPDDVQVSSVTFTVVVGQPGPEGAPLTPTTAGVKTLVSDRTTWSFVGPSSPVTSGTADYVLSPAVRSTATLAAGASLYVEIYDFQTVPAASTSTVTVEEVIGGGDPVFTSFAISTFPDGFFFDGLTVNIPSGSALVPVAQVATGTGVTLTWNSSVVDTASQTVFWSSATGGQQQATPTKLGEWSTPPAAPLTSDTVFVVVVTAQGIGDEPLTASLATSVSVQNPTIVAASVDVAGALSAGSATVSGGLTAASASLSGALSAGNVTAASASLSGELSAGNVTAASASLSGELSAGNVTAASASLSGALSAGSVSAGSGTFTGGLQATQAKVSVFGAMSILDSRGGTYVANTDVLVLGTIGMTGRGLGVIEGRTIAATVVAVGIRNDVLQMGSFLLPVAAGQSCALIPVRVPLFPTPSISFWAVPLGSPPPGKPVLEYVGPPPPPGVQLPEEPQGGSP